MDGLVILVVVFMSLILLLGDFMIKYAVGKPNWFVFLIIAGALWCSSIYGWYYTVKENRIAIVGMLFSIISLVGSVLIGVLFFNEKLTVTEWVGLAFGITASILLSGKI